MSRRHFFCSAWFLSCLFAPGILGQAPTLAGQDDDPLPRGALLRMGSSRLTHGSWLTSLKFSADDRYIGSADSHGTVRLWETATGKLVWEKPERTGRTLAFSPDGKMLAIGGYYNRQITLWDLQTNKILRELSQNARAL